MNEPRVTNDDGHDQESPSKPTFPSPGQNLVYASTPQQTTPPSEQEHDDDLVLPATEHRSGKPLALGLGIGIVIGVAAGLLIGLVAIPATSASVSASLEEATESPLITAVDACSLEDEEAYVRIGDDGASLDVQTDGAEAPGISYSQFDCVLSELEVSDAVRSRIESTRALDGRQEGSWDGITASWTYHPDDGLSILFEFDPDNS